MKLCFNAGPEPMEEYFTFAHENGFPWMELSCNNPNNFLDKWNPERIDNVKRLRDKYGLRYGLHSASFVNAAEIEPIVKVAAQEHLIKYVQLAHDLGAEYIVLHFGYHFSLFMDEVFRCLIDTYKPVVELAEKYELPIGIENMNKMHEDCEVAYLGVTPEELSRVFDAIPSDYFGLTLDIAHANLLPGGSDPFIDAFSDRIISTHVSDNDLVLDHHLPVGEGKIDFKQTFKRLIEIDFKGTLNIELPRSNEDRLLSKKRLEPILEELGVLETALKP
ncbi:MAG: sugar phosphate isomerase/epimerase [Desulfobacterales bacterium]|nr:sugar phosphate isomerase/epimerase [Deltaproteobacteria bacterium]NNK95397.1 sugar phosphate isomerase/epimerase [Desulfobacterales bacterium]